jgi:glyoxylase-like metal-dependent hydrolase (beta-lactamase superfamily II)
MHWRQGWGDTFTAVAFAWLVENGNQAILIDTGVGGIDTLPDLPQESFNREGAIWSQAMPGGVIGCLNQHGLEPGDISFIVLSHLHFDHMGNVPIFPNATYGVSDVGLRFAFGTEPGLNARYPYDILNWLRQEAADRVQPLSQGEVIVDGITVQQVGGHTPCSQVVFVETGSTKLVFPGDVIPTVENLDPECPTGNYQNLDALLEASRFCAESGTVIPSHDARSPDLLMNAQ